MYAIRSYYVPIPENTMLDDYDSVVIWCKKFDVGIGKATLGMSGIV